MIKQLNEILELKRYDDFFACLPEIISELTEEEKQELLVDIIDFHRKLHSKFINAFDLIIDDKLNLNFNIEHWAPTFLSLIVLRTPSIEIFKYFIDKGASVNFIADTLAFEEEENLNYENDNLLFRRFQTCLDFTQIQLDNLLGIDYNYDIPDNKVDSNLTNLYDQKKEITLDVNDYLYLYEQSEYLHHLVSISKLKDFIIQIGGKTYKQLNA